MEDIALLVGTLIFTANAARRVLTYWTGRAPLPPPAFFWPLSARVWRAYTRSVALVPAFIIGEIVAAGILGSGVLALGILLSNSALIITIMLFNKPAVLVPPPYRSEPGLWTRSSARRTPRS